MGYGRRIATEPKDPERAAQTAWRSVRNIPEALASHERDMAYAMENVYPQDAAAHAGVVSRPGYLLTNGGRVAVGEAQDLGFIERLDGTVVVYLVLAGEVYTYDWGTDAWSLAVSAADQTAAGVALPGTGRVFSNDFNDEVVFNPHDGVNKPWSWDGTAGDSGVTALTNAPVAYGRPEVYYAKLFLIGWSSRTEIYWSEENQANTGYDSGGYNNAWQLGQTESGEINVLIPTNEVLYYQRRNSTGAISGRVTPEFQTTGVQEAVSGTIGSSSPDGWVLVEDTIYFMDSQRRIQALQVGGGLLRPEPWRLSRGLQREIAVGFEERIQAAYLCDTELVMFGVPTGAEDQIDVTMNVASQVGVFCGRFTGLGAGVLSVVRQDNGCDRLMHATKDGYVFLHQPSSETRPRDQDRSGTDVPIRCVFESAPLFYGLEGTRIIQRLDLALLSWGFSGLSLSLVTERGNQETGIVFTESSPGGALWGVAEWGVAEWSGGGGGEGTEVRLSVGLDQYCRWARVRLVHEEIGERWGVTAMMATAFSEGEDVRWT